MATVIGNTYGLKVATKPKKARHIKPKKLILQDADHEDRDDDGRNIAAFPSSPSFRIFFGDAAIHNQIGNTLFMYNFLFFRILIIFAQLYLINSLLLL